MNVVRGKRTGAWQYSNHVLSPGPCIPGISQLVASYQAHGIYDLPDIIPGTVYGMTPAAAACKFSTTLSQLVFLLVAAGRQQSNEPAISQIRSDQIRSDQIRSDQIRSDQIRPDQIRPDLDHIRLDQIRSRPDLLIDQIRSDRSYCCILSFYLYDYDIVSHRLS